MGEEENKELTKRCPYCAEEILAAAKMCKHCGSMLDAEPQLTEEYPVAPAQVNTGQTLNERYVIASRIARGGMAEIFLARDLELDLDVALKVVPPTLADDPRLIKHLRDEAKIAIQLTHQNIVRIYSFDASGEIKFIVMEYVPGKNLYQLINEAEEGKFPPKQVIEWLRPVCEAIAYAHSLGVIHGDLKPSNLMVTENGLVKVADFGIARRLEDSMMAISQHTVRGTPSYMSSEQLRGKKLSILSDIYSLAATTYMLLSGSPPFNSAVIAASSDRPDPDPIVGTPPRLFRVLKKGLDLDPHKRYQSVQEFYEAAKDAVEKPLSSRIMAAIEPTPAEPHVPEEEHDAEEVPIRVDAEELPEGMDALAVTMRDKAVKAVEAGDFEKAVMLFAELGQIAPENPEAWIGLGDARMKTGDYRNAIEAYQKAVKVEYENIYARYQIGLAYEHMKNPEKAIRIYQQAIKVIEDDPSLNLEISINKLKNQIENVEWQMQQADEQRRKELHDMRQREEQKRSRDEERRRKAVFTTVIIIVILILLVLGIGIAEYFVGIFKYLPF